MIKLDVSKVLQSGPQLAKETQRKQLQLMTLALVLKYTPVTISILDLLYNVQYAFATLITDIESFTVQCFIIICLEKVFACEDIICVHECNNVLNILYTNY